MSLNVNNSKHRLNHRWHSIDICRGLALVLMVQAHISPHIEGLSNFANILAAPFFLIISGFSYDLFLESRTLKEKMSHVKNESIFRGILIYSIPLIPYILVCTPFFAQITERDYTFSLLHWGVFQVIGIGYIFGSFIPINIKSKAFITVFSFETAYLISTFHIQTLYPLTSDVFPLIPWIGYFFVGRVLYELYKNKLLIGINGIKLSIVTLFITVTIFVVSGEKLLATTRTRFIIFLLLTSIQFLIISLLVPLVDCKQNQSLIFKSLQKLGKICFSGYYLHFAIIFIINRLKFNSIAWINNLELNLLIFIFIIGLLLQIEKMWSNYNYKYGLEWLIRKGTNQFLKYQLSLEAWVGGKLLKS